MNTWEHSLLPRLRRSEEENLQIRYFGIHEVRVDISRTNHGSVLRRCTDGQTLSIALLYSWKPEFARENSLRMSLPAPVGFPSFYPAPSASILDASSVHFYLLARQAGAYFDTRDDERIHEQERDETTDEIRHCRSIPIDGSFLYIALSPSPLLIRMADVSPWKLDSRVRDYIRLANRKAESAPRLCWIETRRCSSADRSR